MAASLEIHATTMLLDTNTLLYATIWPEKLPEKWRVILNNTDKAIYVSAVSLWEIAIKDSLNKSDFDVDALLVLNECRNVGFALLDISADIAIKVGKLPFHHGDPFDRLLIVQAQELKIPIMTMDKAFKRYDVGLVPRA